MNNKSMNRFMNPARWLMSAARFGLALLLVALLATTAQAAIAIQDGNPLVMTRVITASSTPFSKSFTVTPGAKVLVVILEDRGAANPEPATLPWIGGQTLTRDVQSLANVATVRCMAVYHLYNPTPGTAIITNNMSANVSSCWLTAYTLNGVDTTIPPVAAQATTGTSTALSSLSLNINGVAAGSWAAIGSVLGTSPTTVTEGGTGGTTTDVNSTTVDGTSAYAGYVSGLSAGTVTFTSSFSQPSKTAFCVEVFSPPTAPSISVQPTSVIAFTNGAPRFSVTAIGTAPLSYQWYTNSSAFPLSNGGNLTGTTNSVLNIANATLANAGNYFVVVTNSLGAVTSSVASLAFTSPSGAYESAVMTNSAAPFAFYRFGETSDPSSGTVVAQDSIGSFNGAYGMAAQNGFNSVFGPQTTVDGLVGFPDGNTALGTIANTANSLITLPPFNLNNGVGTNVLTITAWIYPNGAPVNNSGIVYCRAGTTVAGLCFFNTGGSLGYNWHDEGGAFNWNSGLVPPQNVWSLVALVVTPTNNTIYLFNTNNGLLSATHVYTHVLQKFDGVTLIGQDSLNVNRTFNGSIDEVALFGQALTTSQMGALFSTASGIANFTPSIAANPTWAPATVYPGMTASITVNAGGTTPLSYQWLAGAVGSGIYTNVVNGGSTSGATSATLTITNAQLGNYLDYVVQVSNPYGSVTSTVPATLTVLEAGPATTFTLNYTGLPIQQGVGADWNNVNMWSPLGVPASTAVFANPGSTFEVIVGSRLRNPAGTTYNVFPGDTLMIDGNGGFENGTANNIGEIRIKNSLAPGVPATTNYFKNLVLNGGQINLGDDTALVLLGMVTVANNSTFETIGTGTNQTYRVDSYLTGSGTIQLYLSTSNQASSLNITGNTNTFTGQWNIQQGPLVGSGLNSLGTNTITIGRTNGILETSYPINNPNASLVLNGKMFLTQNDTFKSVYVNGLGLAPGTYSAATLSASYPSNFPATFIALNGTAATTASGQITVLSVASPLIGANPTWTPATIYVGQTSSITVSSIIGTPPFSYQWMSGAVGSGVYTDLPNGGNISGATSATLTITNAQLANYLDYVVRINNAGGVVTSTVPATLAINDSAPFVVTDTAPNPATYYASFTATLTAAFDGSRPIAYQWVTDGGSGTFTNVPGATNSTLVISNVQAGNTGNYYLVATNLAGGPASSSPSSLTVVPSTYAIHFGATNAITTADAVLNHPGVVTGAAVFGNTATLVTLGNGSSLTFTANGSVATVAPGNTGGNFAYPAPNTTGNTNFDAVLNQCNFDLGPKIITLNNLVAGHNYSLLLIGLDARGGLVAGSASARLAYFQDPVVPTDVSSTFHMGDNVYVMASFLAETTTQTIIEQLPTANNGNMNALVVYDLSAVVTPPTLSLAPSGGGNLTLTWSAGSMLLQATNLLGPWTTNSTATSPYTVSPTNAQDFFRVRTP